MYVSYIEYRHVWDAVIRKRLEKWRTKSWFLLHNNAPAHWSVSVKDILAKNNVATVEHPSYSPDRFQLIYTLTSCEISIEETALL